jgi:hypothetical protein
MRGKLTPNEFRNKLQEACAKHSYDPFEELIVLATTKVKMKIDGKDTLVHLLDSDQRIQVAKEIAQYVAPKLKGIEVKGEIDNKLEITVKTFSAIAPAEKPAIDVGGATRSLTA